MSFLQQDVPERTRCNSHIYIAYEISGVPMVYVAPKQPTVAGYSPHQLEAQLEDFETACRAASLFLNEDQLKYKLALLNLIADAHSSAAAAFKRRSIQLASDCH